VQFTKKESFVIYDKGHSVKKYFKPKLLKATVVNWQESMHLLMWLDQTFHYLTKSKILVILDLCFTTGCHVRSLPKSCFAHVSW